MRRFGENIFYWGNSSFFHRIVFFLFGQDFIGAAIRFAHFRKALKKIPYFNSVLDAGSGTGDFTFYVAERYPNSKIVGIDIVRKTIEKNNSIRKKLCLENIDFQFHNLLENIPKKYDFIFSIGTLIYFSKEDVKKIITNLKASLNEDGYLYLDLPQEDFLEILFIPTKYYSTLYDGLKKENSGELYTFNEMIDLLNMLGFNIVLKNKSFSYFGKLAWEFDNVLREKRLYHFRTLLLPILKLFATIDSWKENKKGCCYVILAQKQRKT